MMKGLMKKSAAAAAALALSVSTFTFASAFGGVTESSTPTDKNDTALYWATKGGSGWSQAPSVPLVVGDKIYFTAGKKLKVLDKNTGEYLDAEGDLAANPGYNLVSPIYADGKIIVALTGKLQAFDAETLESLWVYTDELGGQGNSELTYSDGYVYTGYWSGEAKNANFVCVPVEDTDPDSPDEDQQAAWTYTSTGGFYWAGGYDTGDYIVVSTDDGKSGSTNVGSHVISFDKAASIKSGEPVLASVSEDLTGDLRSAVSYDEETGYYFVTSKAKLIYRFKVSDTGEISDVESLELSGASTSTPIAANGRVYVGTSGTGQFTENSGSGIVVIDSEKFEIVYAMATRGYPQSSALISDRDGENYVYFTENYTPGRVYAFHDNKDMTEPEKTETAETNGKTYEYCPTLFTPTGEQAQYCLASLTADEDGTLYFKNDSCYIMALGSKVTALKAEGKTLYREGDSFDTDSIKVTAVLANGVEKDVTKYAEWTELTDALEAGEDELSVSYDGMLYGDTDDEIGHEYGDVYTSLEYTVLPAADYDALEAAEQAIAAITEITPENKELFVKANALYSALSDELKAYVTNADILSEAEEYYTKMDKAVEDCTAAIEAIGSVTHDSGAAIENARGLYDALDDEWKPLVKNYDVLTAAEESYKNLPEDVSSTESSDESSETTSSSESGSSSEITSDSSSESSSVGAVTDTASSSAASSTSSSAAADSNPATGAAAAISAIAVLAGAAVTVLKKNK